MLVVEAQPEHGAGAARGVDRRRIRCAPCRRRTSSTSSCRRSCSATAPSISRRRGRRFLEVEPTTRDYGFPRRNAFRQPVLENLLRDALEQFDTVDPPSSTALEEFSSPQPPVSLRCAATARNRRSDCDYLVGADGSRQPAAPETRHRHCTAPRSGERWLILDLERPRTRRSDTEVYCNPAPLCLSLPGPNGTRRFEFMLQKDEQDADLLAPANVAELLRPLRHRDRAGAQAQGRLHLSRPHGGSLARRPDFSRRRRGTSDAAFRRSGHEQRRARRA